MPKKLPSSRHSSTRIGIDCRLAGIENSGIGRYVAQLVHQLLVIDQASTYVLFCRNKQQANLLTQGNDGSRYEIVICDITHYSILEQLAMPVYFWRAKLDLLHVPHFNVPILNFTPLVVTIHDLLWHQYRGTQVTTLSPITYLAKYLFYKLVVSHAIGQAQQILVPSNTIKQTIETYYPNTIKKIRVTYEGITQLPSPQALETKLPSKYILYVGNLYPHKNVMVILQALTKLTNIHLIICGSRDAFSQQVINQAKQLNLMDRVHHLGKVTDGQLAFLYQHALSLIQPSKSEGFGLTGLEAMSQNCPVIASDIPIFREIYQNAAYFFDPENATMLVSQIHLIDSSPNRINLLSQQAQLLVNYSWHTMAKETLTAYQALLKQADMPNV